MSLGARATKGGAKGKDRHGQDKGKTDKPQPKEKVKPQATTEQLRMANMIDRKSDDTADVRKMVKMVQDLMEMTCRTEDEVCSALHDADNDVVVACNILLEAQPEHTGEWQTSEKKKKKPPAVTNNGEADPPRDARHNSAPRPRRGSGERGERESSGRGRGMRGARGGRGGGRGGARGGRGPPRHRGEHHDNKMHNMHSDANPMGDTFPATEDWDNEEWSGSLSDTKVFTPSVNPSTNIEGDAAPPRPTEDWDTPEVGADHIPTYTYHNPAAHHTNIEPSEYLQQPLPTAGTNVGSTVGNEYVAGHQPMGMSGSLSAAQSHYLSQLTQQSQLQHAPLKPPTNSVYTTNYGVYASTDITSQRKPQRARVPPPSKIPVSAVEMPGGGSDTQFLDVQFGAGDDTIEPAKQVLPPMPAAAPPAAPPAVPPAMPPAAPPAPPVLVQEVEPVATTYTTTSTATSNNILSESVTSSESPVSSQPVVAEPVVSNATSSLEKQLSATMKQMSVTEPAPHHLSQHRPAKPAATATAATAATAASAAAAVNMYSHHPVSHHPPPLYSANVYPHQVNSSNASLTGAAALPAAYPSSVVTQYQPIMNSYQTSAAAAGGGYSSTALYTAPYTYTQHNNKLQQPLKDNVQYESNAVASSNSLTSTQSTTQTSTAKVTTTTGHGVSGGTGSSSAAYGGALYGSQQYTYDEQMLRSTMPHHMGGYYEVTGYGVGVGAGARDAASFSLSATERFSRSDAASPQQVPTPTLPPGYAYYAYQPPPPTTYQYGVYPFSAGSNVGGGGKVPSYGQQQQPQYDAQDSYKPVSGGGVAAYGGGTKSAAAPDLAPAIYPKPHVALNKVNSYEKAGFHSGTPPPFGAASHLYIAAPHHHHHAPQHQESGSSGGRSSSKQSTHSKPSYSHSYWPPN